MDDIFCDGQLLFGKFGVAMLKSACKANQLNIDVLGCERLQNLTMRNSFA